MTVVREEVIGNCRLILGEAMAIMPTLPKSHLVVSDIPYPIEIGGVKVCTYVGDFSYLTKTGAPVTEDVKGVATDAFRIKAKLFRALFGRDVVIVRTAR